MEETIKSDTGALTQMYPLCLIPEQNTGMCLLVVPSTINREELGAQEWRDAIFLHCGVNPPYMP